MNTNPHVSPETDRRAYQVQQNIINLARFREHRKRLYDLGLELAQAVMATHPYAVIESTEAAIKSGQHQLEIGESLSDAITHSCSLLEEGLA